MDYDVIHVEPRYAIPAIHDPTFGPAYLDGVLQPPGGRSENADGAGGTPGPAGATTAVSSGDNDQADLRGLVAP